MSDSTDRIGNKRQVPWNDIRRVGPVLMVILAAILMINPSFVGSEASVGDAGLRECVEADDATIGVLILDESCDDPDPCASPSLAALPEGGCCIVPEVIAIGGLAFPLCPPPPPEPEPTPVESPTPAATPTITQSVPPLALEPLPDPIMGPIYLGAIQVDSITSSVHRLEFPPLLARFVATNVVTVTDGGGDVVFEGQLGSNDRILVVNASFPLTVDVILSTQVPYVEVVPGPASN